MGEVVDINPAHRLVAPLRRELEQEGSTQQDLDELRELGVDADQWRGAARRAARLLRRPVQTGAGSSSVWAVLRDWPATESERVRHQEQLRRVVEAAARVDLDPGAPCR